MPELPPSPPSGPPGRLPDVLVIGTATGCTAALHHSLRHHPQVAMAREKELDFLLDPGALPADPRGFDRGARHLAGLWINSLLGRREAIAGAQLP